MSGSAFKKIMLGALALILVAIWIRNLFLFVPATRSVEAPSVANKHTDNYLTTSEISRDTIFALDPGIRDPFSLPKKPQPKAAKASIAAKVESPTETIRASLMGHVLNSDRPYLVVFDSVTSEPDLYRTGDTLNGFVLRKISRAEIHWTSMKGRRVVWKLDP